MIFRRRKPAADTPAAQPSQRDHAAELAVIAPWVGREVEFVGLPTTHGRATGGFIVTGFIDNPDTGLLVTLKASPSVHGHIFDAAGADHAGADVAARGDVVAVRIASFQAETGMTPQAAYSEQQAGLEGR
jgi:hypothetical protein